MTTTSHDGRLGGVLGGLAAVLRAEPLAAAGVRAPGEHAVEVQPLAQRRDVGGRLPAAADDAEARGARPREQPGRDRGGGSGAPLAEQVRLDDRRHLGPLEREEHDEKRRAARQPRERLQPGVAELEVDARHHREHAVGQLDAQRGRG